MRHLPVKERIKKIELYRIRIGFVVDTLTSVDFEEIVNTGVVFKIDEAVIYKEKFEVNPNRNVIELLFKLGLKYRDEHEEVMHFSANFSMNSLYGL